MKKILVYLLAAVYILGGINHFWHPEFYLGMIPTYLPAHTFINYASGIVELLLGLLVLFPVTRRMACFGIIILLIAFIPAHIYFIQMNGCVSDALCVSPLIAWVRLIVIHPVLIYWAYSCRNIK